ncbi:MAG: hypothetical protein ACRD5E_08665 [Nitrososphaeraceae archaeon]
MAISLNSCNYHYFNIIIAVPEAEAIDVLLVEKGFYADYLMQTFVRVKELVDGTVSQNPNEQAFYQVKILNHL